MIPSRSTLTRERRRIHSEINPLDEYQMLGDGEIFDPVRGRTSLLSHEGQNELQRCDDGQRSSLF
jgi:hypothetical protein